jgi:hypothetical protein
MPPKESLFSTLRKTVVFFRLTRTYLRDAAVADARASTASPETPHALGRTWSRRWRRRDGTSPRRCLHDHERVYASLEDRGGFVTASLADSL